MMALLGKTILKLLQGQVRIRVRHNCTVRVLELVLRAKC